MAGRKQQPAFYQTNRVFHSVNLFQKVYLLVSERYRKPCFPSHITKFQSWAQNSLCKSASTQRNETVLDQKSPTV